MSSVFHFLSNPITHLLFFITVALVAFALKRNALLKLTLVFALFWGFLIGCSPFSQWWLARLEHEYVPFQQTSNLKDSVHILILGAGHVPAQSQPAVGQLVPIAVVRLVEGLRIYRQVTGSKLVLSGSSYTTGLTQAEVAAMAAIELGLRATDTLQLRSPRNTQQEIEAYVKRFGTKRQIIVVTSANHMPRAMLLCTKHGLTAMAAPTNFYQKYPAQPLDYNFKPSLEKLSWFQMALREHVGIQVLQWGL